MYFNICVNTVGFPKYSHIEAFFKSISTESDNPQCSLITGISIALRFEKVIFLYTFDSGNQHL